MSNPSQPSSPPALTGLWERRLVAGLILLTLLLSSLPYALGYFIAAYLPQASQFVGTAYNIDDYCNYLSWLRQTMQGHFFLLSLFTTDPQKGLEFNVFFYGLGRLAHYAHLSPQAVLQIARVVGAVALLWLIARFYRLCLPDNAPARLTAFGFACLSSGWGWITWSQWRDKNYLGGPVDAWQPEAYTFLTVYTSALMTVSTVLILATLYALLRGEQTGKWRYAVVAGLCGAVLGNMHSYDVLHLSAAWGLYLVVWTLLRRGRGVLQSWLRGLLALGLTLPTTVYQYMVFNQETVFRQRANVATLSPAVWHYALGYGLVFLLALVAAWLIFQAALLAPNNGGAGSPPAPSVLAPPLLGAGGATSGGLLFPLCWAVAGLAVIYLPFAFQRKMLMGEHIPLCLLAGVGAATVTRTLAPRARALALGLLVLASAPSNLLFLTRDVNHLERNRSETLQFPFLPDTLVGTYRWIEANTSPGATFLGAPQFCAYLPGYTGRVVWVGHWAETPDYAGKTRAVIRFQDARTSDEERRLFLQSTGVQYLLYTNDISRPYYTKDHVPHQFADLVHHTPSYLTPVYANQDYTVFRIALNP